MFSIRNTQPSLEGTAAATASAALRSMPQPVGNWPAGQLTAIRRVAPGSILIPPEKAEPTSRRTPERPEGRFSRTQRSSALTFVVPDGEAKRKIQPFASRRGNEARNVRRPLVTAPLTATAGLGQVSVSERGASGLTVAERVTVEVSTSAACGRGRGEQDQRGGWERQLLHRIREATSA